MKPHKHADLIKAWADGAEIEERHKSGGWYDFDGGFWSDSDEFEYRIKPEKKKPVKRWLWVWKWSDCPWCIVDDMMSDEEVKERMLLRPQNKYRKLPWSEMEFDE